MNSLKKGEGIPLLNFEGGPAVLLLNFRGVPRPTFKLWGESRVLGSGVLVPLLHHAVFLLRNTLGGLSSAFLICSSQGESIYPILLNRKLYQGVWKVSKYRVISGPYFPVYGPEITPHLDTFHAVGVSVKYFLNE